MRTLVLLTPVHEIEHLLQERYLDVLQLGGGTVDGAIEVFAIVLVGIYRDALPITLWHARPEKVKSDLHPSSHEESR